jgi:broad specificity phosphatase PhoE
LPKRPLILLPLSIPSMPRTIRFVLFAAALLAAAPAAAQDSTVVILVRHAEKAAVEGNDPPLSEAGQARARALAQVLADVRVDAVVASERQRTRLTAEPLAAARGLGAQAIGLSAGHVDSVAAAVRRHAGHTVLVVGHSNTVPRIIHALGGPEMRDLCEPEFAHLYVLVLKDGAAPRLEERTYGAPDPADAANCPPSH